jgi:hypothetical protein
VAARHCAELRPEDFLNTHFSRESEENSEEEEKQKALSEEEIRERRRLLEVPETFEEWNEQFEDSSEEYLGSYSEEHGMTVREFRMMIYESENEAVTGGKGWESTEKYSLHRNTRVEQIIKRARDEKSEKESV